MKKDRIFLTSDRGPGSFEFNAEVAEVFDDMLVRSIPFYLEQQAMILELCKRWWPQGTIIYDLGCSTATTLIALARELPAARLVGYDSSSPMLDRASKKRDELNLKDRIDLRYGDLNGELSELSLENAGIIIMAWTLQFVPPRRREKVIRWIYDSLAEDGVLLVSEKVLPGEQDFKSLFTDVYYQFKRQRGYVDEEIARKREALENVLVPYRIDENLALFRRSGFELAETFFQWFNFASFLCIKKPATISL